MKKIFITLVLIAAFIVSLTGCGSQNDGTEEAFVPTGELSAQNVSVDVADSYNGFYDLLADVTVSFNDDGELEWVYAENAVVLAFRVSDYYEGGVYVYSDSEMDEMLDALKAIAKSLDDTEDLQRIIEQLENGGPIEGAST